MSFVAYALDSIKTREGCCCVTENRTAKDVTCNGKEPPKILIEINVSGVAVLHSINKDDEAGSWQV